ncbi:MAG: radical SAM protein [Candidatus Alcyoniella australis]|nr:radical SAM protein [Candidatus Alcyoniella australis]
MSGVQVALVQCPFWTVEDPPLGMAYLVAALRNAEIEVAAFDFGVELHNELPPEMRPYFHADRGLDRDRGSIGIDEMIQQKIEGWAQRVLSSGARIVGLSIFFTTEEVSFKLARAIRRRDPQIAIVFGGPSCNRNVHAQRFIQSDVPDAVVVGEGERTAVELVRSLLETGRFEPVPGALVRRDGEVLDGGDRPLIEPVDQIAFPEFADLLPLGYARGDVLSVTSSRGCPNHCKYCSERGFWQRYRCRSGENLFEEIKLHAQRFGIYKFNMVDSILNADVRKLERFCDLVIESGIPIRWYGMAMPHRQMTPELLRKMRAAGCTMLQYGIESLSPSVRKSMGKSDDIAMVERVLRDTNAAGIRIHGLMIIGFPGERRRDLWRTMWGIVRLRKVLDYVVRPTCPCVLLPNSPIYEEREQLGIKLEDELYAQWETDDPPSNFASRSRDLDRFKRLLERLKIPGELGSEIFEPAPVAWASRERLDETQRRVRITDVSGPASLANGQSRTYRVSLQNPSERYWAGRALASGTPIGLAYHWRERDGSVAVFDDSQRAYLERTLPPGGVLDLEIEVAAPKRSGAMLLEFTLVQDNVGWFEPENPQAASIEVHLD